MRPEPYSPVPGFVFGMLLGTPVLGMLLPEPEGELRKLSFAGVEERFGSAIGSLVVPLYGVQQLLVPQVPLAHQPLPQQASPQELHAGP